MQAIEGFSQATKEALKSYVYVLIDPSDGRIFYVGKGKDDRVFQHAKDALERSEESDKLNIIKEIKAKGLEVKYYILRHDLSEDEAYKIESAFIDFLTFKAFNFDAKLSNKVAGHYQWDKGIKTVEEIELSYNCEELDLENKKHKLLCININRTYDSKGDTYEATRGNWVLDPKRANQADYVVAEYRGIIRAIFEVNEKGWQKASDENATDEKKPRYCFEGKEVTDEKITDLYLHKRLPKKSTGQANPIWYLYNIKS